MTLRPLISLCVLLPAFTLGACRSVESRGETKTTAAATHQPVGTDPGGAGAGTPLVAKDGHQLAAFAGGCFWGVEDVFRQVPGVVATAVGYAGWHTANPSYEDVCTHTTGHAETVLVEFDPTKITYPELLNVFFKNHDPTTMNRQGPDFGEQYRSAIFAATPQQKTEAEAYIKELSATPKFASRKIVTVVQDAPVFFPAEDYHQDYHKKHGGSCRVVQ